MNLSQIIKTELYKICHRKSSLMLLIPMLLVMVITLGYSKGIIRLQLTTTDNAKMYSCMDFVFIVWNVLTGLGIIGILLILFAAFQFSGEIEHGQIKLMLLRVNKRRTVVLGKYIAALIISYACAAVALMTCIAAYYLLIAHTSMGTGTFASTIGGLSSTDIIFSIGLQLLMYLIFIGITFLIGLFANPFVTFILTMICMYTINYLAGTKHFVSKLMPAYWSNELMLNGTISAIHALYSGCFSIMVAAFILLMSMTIFHRQDIK